MVNSIVQLATVAILKLARISSYRVLAMSYQLHTQMLTLGVYTMCDVKNLIIYSCAIALGGLPTVLGPVIISPKGGKR